MTNAANSLALDTEYFLSKILPTQGTYQMAVMIGGSPIHKSFTTTADLAPAILSADKDNVTLYHACAAYKDGKNRTAANTEAMRCFWLDLDCGDDKAVKGKGYADQPAAFLALKAFVANTGLPKPMVVDSGGGLHVYWPLMEAIPTDKWKMLAEQLKSMTHMFGLFADDSRTSDASSVLRPVGTHNRKYTPPRLVRLLMDAQAVDVADIEQCLKKHVSPNNREHVHIGTIPVQTAAPAASIREQANPDNYTLEEVRDALKNIDPSLNRMDWVAIGMVIADSFGPCGFDLFDEWSRGDLWKGVRQ